MSTETDIAASYLIRAEEIRTIAGMDRDIITRKVLEDVARDYELMARSMEAIHRTNVSMQKKRSFLF
jgi:hypothetical protein